MHSLSPLLRLIESRARETAGSTPYTTALTDALAPLKKDAPAELLVGIAEIFMHSHAQARILKRELTTHF
jgi:hypothetical protein